MTKISGIGSTATALSSSYLMEVENGAGGSEKLGPVLMAQELRRLGLLAARVELSATLTGVNWSTAQTFSWGTEKFDLGSWWTVGSPTIFTVPSGVAYVEAWLHVGLQNLSGDFTAWIDANIGGGGFNDSLLYGYGSVIGGGTGNAAVNVSTGPFAVSPGDTIRARGVSSDSSININHTRCKFGIKAVG